MLKEIIKGICIVFYEALCCKLFLGVFLKQKKEQWESFSFIILTIVLMAIATISHYSDEYVLRSGAVIGTIVLYSVVFYTGSWLMKLFFGIVFYGMMSCVDYMGIILADRFLSPSVLEIVVVQIIIVLLCKTALFLLILLLGCYWEKDDIQQMKNSSWIIMLGFPSLTVATMLLLLVSYQKSSNTMGYLTVSLGMVIMNIIMFLLLQFVSAKEKHIYQLQLLQERNKEKMQAYHEISASNEFQKSILHDYGNQLSCIQGLLKEKQYDKAHKYTEQLTESIHEGMDVVNVNNAVINVILNQKYHLAGEKGIVMSFQLNDLSDVWLEEQDLVILISNVLDNAIEGCEKSVEKAICIKVTLEKSEMVLSVKNTIGQPVNIENGVIHSSKKDKNKHGIGLKNVQMVLDKYDGMGRMRYEKGWFYYTAIIPK